MKGLNKKILLLIGSILSLFFIFLETKDNQILNNVTSVNTANADVVLPPDPPADTGCGSSSGSCGSSGG